MYETDHAAYLRRRAEWFQRPGEAITVAWWIPAGTIPTLDDAVRRLNHLREHGPSDEGFPLTRRIPPPPDPEEVTPVPEASTVGTSDPFTALLAVLDRLPATGRCEAEASVWDGRRRYDLTISHLGEKTLVADRPWAYEGSAIGCALEFERIGGFWRERPSGRDPDENVSIRRVVWVAEIAPNRWALVRAEVETRYGTVVGRPLHDG